VPTAALMVGTAELAPRINRCVGAAFAHPQTAGCCRRAFAGENKCRLLAIFRLSCRQKGTVPRLAIGSWRRSEPIMLAYHLQAKRLVAIGLTGPFRLAPKLRR
jgi:hypothetical protein